MAVSEQARRRNEFFDDLLEYFEQVLIAHGLEASSASKEAEAIALKLHERWQSHTLVFPKKPQLVFDKQKQQILSEFTGNNISFLVRKYGFSETTIYKWLREETAAYRKQLAEQQGQLDI